MVMVGREEIQELAVAFESKTAEEVLSWACGKFGEKTALASSFGPEDVALIDMLCKIRPGVRVITLDTDYLFRETRELMDQIRGRYAIRLEVFRAQLTIKDMEDKHGLHLYKNDPSLCCNIRKIEPLKRALAPLEAWITGIRRDQTPVRAQSMKVEFDDVFNLIKVNPLVDWSSDEVWKYIRRNRVPYNSLHEKNYPSIGCEPCTSPVAPGDDPRAGRWADKEKTECGLHLKKT